MSHSNVTALLPTTAPTTTDLPYGGNDGGSSLLAEASAVATSFSVGDISNYPTPCIVRIGNERILITSKTAVPTQDAPNAGTLNTSAPFRGYDGSAAAIHVVGARVMLAYVGYLHNRLAAEVIALGQMVTGALSFKHGITVEATVLGEVPLTLILADEVTSNKFVSFKREVAGVTSEVGAVVYDATEDSLEFQGIDIELGANSDLIMDDGRTLYFGTSKDIALTRGAADRLDLASGDSLNIVLGNFQMAGTTLFESDLDLAVNLIPNSANALDLGSTTREFRNGYLGDGGRWYFGSDQDAQIGYVDNASGGYVEWGAAGVVFIRAGVTDPSVAANAAYLAGATIVDLSRITSAKSCTATISVGVGKVLILPAVTLTWSAGIPAIEYNSNSTLLGLNHSLSIVKGSFGGALVRPLTGSRRYDVEMRSFRVDNTSRATAAGIGVDLTDVTSSTIASVASYNVETAFKVHGVAGTGGAYYNTLKDIRAENVVDGLVVTGTANATNVEAFYAKSLTGIGIKVSGVSQFSIHGYNIESFVTGVQLDGTFSPTLTGGRMENGTTGFVGLNNPSDVDITCYFTTVTTETSGLPRTSRKFGGTSGWVWHNYAELGAGNPATSGAARFANGVEAIVARNAANSANITILKLNASDRAAIGAEVVIDPAGGSQTLVLQENGLHSTGGDLYLHNNSSENGNVHLGKTGSGTATVENDINIVSVLKIGGTTLFEADRDLSLDLTPNADNTLDLGSTSRRFAEAHIVSLVNGTVLVSSAAVTDGALIDSPALTLRAKYDSDAGGGVTSANRDSTIIHNITAGGGGPASQLDFTVAGTLGLSVYDSGLVNALGSFAIAGTTLFESDRDVAVSLLPNASASLDLGSAARVWNNLHVRTITVDNQGAGADPTLTSSSSEQTLQVNSRLFISSGLSQLNALTLSGGSLSAPGQRDGNFLVHLGFAHDGSAHTTEWRLYPDVTSNAGASAYTWQSRIDAAAFATRMSLDDAGLLNAVGGLAIASTTLFEADRDLAVDLLPNADNTLDLGSAARRYAEAHAVTGILGGLRTGVTTKSANYTIATGDTTIYGTGGAGGITLSLPAATGSGRLIMAKKADAAAGAVTLDADGTDLIDGAGTYALTVQWAAVILQDVASGVWAVF